jgi:FKBP-type peptidyl-prolyl cis-trans isomerase
VGGSRLLVIPGSLGYGPTPPDGSGIQPDETLIFIVELSAIS